jgi:hypothetical protein
LALVVFRLALVVFQVGTLFFRLALVVFQVGTLFFRFAWWGWDGFVTDFGLALAGFKWAVGCFRLAAAGFCVGLVAAGVRTALAGLRVGMGPFQVLALGQLPIRTRDQVLDGGSMTASGGMLSRLAPGPKGSWMTQGPRAGKGAAGMAGMLFAAGMPRA